MNNLHLLSFFFSAAAVCFAVYADIQSRRARRYARRATEAHQAAEWAREMERVKGGRS